MALGIGISPMLRRYRSGVSYGAYTTAWYTQVLANGGTATSTELAALTVFENTQGSNMIEYDRLWIHGLSSNIASRISIVNPTSTLISLVNAPTFTANEGYAGNSVNMALETNYNLSTQSVKYTQNSSSAFTYTRININGPGLALGVYLPPNISASFYPRFGGNTIFYNNANAGVDGIGAVPDSLGTISVVRTNSTDVFSYKRGVLSGTLSRASVALLNDTPYILACKGLSFSGNQISASGFGSGTIDQVVQNSALQTLGTTLGWAV